MSQDNISVRYKWLELTFTQGYGAKIIVEVTFALTSSVAINFALI